MCIRDREAYDRGIKFDVGYGINFSYRIAKMMLEEGYPPHTISSDLHGDFNAFHDFSKLDYSLAGAFNRLVQLGLPLKEAVKCLTYTPAVLLRSNDEIGTLAEGSIADITVLKVSATEHTISDSEGKEITLSHTYVPSKVFKDGNLFDTDQNMFQDLCLSLIHI